MIHTVTAVDGSFDSGMLNEGDTFSYTFDTPRHIRVLLHAAPVDARARDGDDALKEMSKPKLIQSKGHSITADLALLNRL